MSDLWWFWTYVCKFDRIGTCFDGLKAAGGSMCTC